jgi:membrane-associated PAP2 superfamily phosphatase
MSRTSRAMLVFTAIAAVVFTAFPQIDLAAARLFYQPGNGFPMEDNPLVNGIYRGITLVVNVTVPALIVAALAGFARRLPAFRAHRTTFVYLLLVLAVGPGLIVNVGLKENWGRARPERVIEFGGAARFTPALLPANQCSNNCSFVSGHVAAAFVPAVLSLVARRRRGTWFAIGAAGAAVAGFSRMAAGRHFLSDAIFAVVIVWFTAALLHRLMFRRSRDGEERTTGATPTGAS